VPNSVLDAAGTLARELGTSRNDAIVRLAEEGVSARAARERIAALASARRAAVERVKLADTSSFPSADELRDAMLAGRRDP
jgi:hypothetical protein